MRVRLLAMLTTVALLACTDAPSAIRSIPAAPSYDFLNGPAEPGPMIFRTGDDGFFLLFNSDRGSNLVDLIRLPGAQPDLVPCGGTEALDQVALQLVFHGSGAINQVMKGRAVGAFVYERRSFLTELRAHGLCAAIASQVPLAQGTADFTAHDNDTFFSGTHADAFGWSAVGLVTAANGAQLRLQDESHGVLAADGSLVTIVASITLRPVKTP